MFSPRTKAELKAAITGLKNCHVELPECDQSLAWWDVSNVRDMSAMFQGAKSFNEDISNWDVSNVDNMNKMFQNTASFDRDLCGANWVDSNAIKRGIFVDSHGSISTEVCANTRGDVCTTHTLPASEGFAPILPNRKLQLLSESQKKEQENQKKQMMTQREYLLAKYTFATKNELQAAIANYTKKNNELAIGEWDVSEITDMQELFKDNKDFNDDISKWQVGQVTDMTAMFKGAETFDQNLYEWDVSSVTDMTEMFSDAKEFRGGGLSTWKTGHVTSMKGMFAGAESFGLPSKMYVT